MCGSANQLARPPVHMRRTVGNMPVSRAVGAAHAQAFATTAALAASAVPAASSGPSPYSISSAAAVSPASSWLANLQAAADGACLAGNALQCSVLQQYAASAAVLI